MRSILLLQLLLASVRGVILPSRFTDLSYRNGTSIELPLVHAQELGIDRRFSIRYQYMAEAIDQRSAFMNTLHFMTTEAYKDFRGIMATSTMVSEPAWPEVAVLATALPGKTLERRYVIWALYQGMYHLSLHGYESISMHLAWDDEEIGIMVYISTDDQSGNKLLEPNDRKNTTKPTSTQGTNKSSPVSQGPANERSSIEPSYLADAASLTRASSFIPMIAALNWLASWPWYDVVTTFSAKNDDFHTSLTLLNVGTGPEPHGPTATTADFIDAIWELTLFMDRRQRFAEIYANVEIVGRLIGKVLLVRVRGGDTVSSNITFNGTFETS